MQKAEFLHRCTLKHPKYESTKNPKNQLVLNVASPVLYEVKNAKNENYSTLVIMAYTSALSLKLYYICLKIISVKLPFI